MTPGQQRAIRELERLQAANPDGFRIVGISQSINNKLIISISLRIGSIEMCDGGLDLRDREEFDLIITPDFPFDYPTLSVTHDRFAGFPHVVWTKYICLYQSKVEWNPADGLYGFFDRLKWWLSKAAINDMDPIEGPLEPPHHITDFSQVPFVIRCNAPVPAGQSWFGLAELEKYPNRIELVAWYDPSRAWPETRNPALAIILPKPLRMEFPKKGADFFRELGKQGMDRDQILKNLALAALFSPEGEPLHLVLGIPMRRAADGSPRLHIAVWTMQAESVKYLRSVFPEKTDSNEIRMMRKEFADLVYSYFENTHIKWCRVLEDRSEIVVRRDIDTPIEWFGGKKVLILGCGALGSWAAEIIVRAKPTSVHLVDNSIVKPGVLLRQNFTLDDIGDKKATALARRLRSIVQGITIVEFDSEAHAFITEHIGELPNYDFVLDCTALKIFQMKLERDWPNFEGRSPLIASMIINSTAQYCLCVVVQQNSAAGVWDAYLALKYQLCLEENQRDVASAFYSERSTEHMFQPEPGCSDPTFLGSTADMFSIVSTTLNLIIRSQPSRDDSVGIVISAPHSNIRTGTVGTIQLPRFHQTTAGQYRVRIAQKVYREARAWIRQNNRIRSAHHETGGLLWGYWDDAIGVIWILDVSGPPLDSQHDPAHFVCGVEGTLEEHKRRLEQTYGTCIFLGFWHTHPNLPAHQSDVDISGMAGLVSAIGQNQKRSLMLIFGRTEQQPTAGIYVYESQSLAVQSELISVGIGKIMLEVKVI